MTDTAPNGSLIGARYRIVQPLGRGGTSTVYLAHDESLQRDVALKVFPVEFSELSDARRRTHEARLLAGTSHPSIVTLFDAALDADPPYLTMEYVPGDDLRTRLAEGPLTPELADDIGASVADGLAFIHERGIVHRDVKPDNVLVPPPGERGRAKLVDFGIARPYEGPAVTTVGSVLGTAGYLSPEQARGERVGSASDVYSLGLVLIECLTGQRPFPGSTAESATARLTRGPDLSAPELAARRDLLERMTAMDPADRPTPTEVSEALSGRARTRILPVAATGQALADATQATERIESPAAAVVPDPPRRGLRRRLALVLAVGLASLVAVVIGIGASGAFAPPDTAPPESTVVKQKAPEVVAPADETEEPGPGNGNGNGKEDKDDKKDE